MSTITMQSLNKKERKLLGLKNTQSRHPLIILDGKVSELDTPQK